MSVTYQLFNVSPVILISAVIVLVLEALQTNEVPFLLFCGDKLLNDFFLTTGWGVPAVIAARHSYLLMVFVRSLAWDAVALA